VGEAVDPDFGRAAGLKVRENGTLEVDRYTLETSRERFYAGGDAISGATNVSNAMGYGKKAARLIDLRLMSEGRFHELFPNFEYDQTPPAENASGRHHPHPLPAVERVNGFQEAVLPITPEEACEEAGRCLRCDIRENGAFALEHR
jgi:NADH-quinone oxidoreductase subunit F